MYAWKTADGRWLKAVRRNSWGAQAVCFLEYTDDINEAYAAAVLSSDVLTFSSLSENILTRVEVTVTRKVEIV